MMYNVYKRGFYNESFKDFVDTNCTTPDFPIKGVNFIDIFPLLAKYEFEDMRGVGTPDEPIVFVPEARGFLFYGVLGAQRCIPMRKKKKLPGDLVTIDYSLEYGTDQISFQKDAVLKRARALGWDKSKPIPVCYFDDICATGNSARAAIEAINSLNIDGYTFKVTTAYFYIELTELNGRSKLEDLTEVFSVYEY